MSQTDYMMRHTQPRIRLVLIFVVAFAFGILGSRPSSGQSARIGLFNPATALFELDLSGNNTFHFIDPPAEAALFPLSGDWDGDGRDSLGLYDRDKSEFHLKNYMDGYWDPATSGFESRTYTADAFFQFGQPNENWVPISGDWDGDGVDTIGLYLPEKSEFRLKNSFESGQADIRIQFGQSAAGLIPISGDWNGDGKDTIGFYDPVYSKFQLWNSNMPGQADESFWFGPMYSGWYPIAGDWNDDGVDTIGLYDIALSQYHLKNSFAGGNGDQAFQFGATNCGWTPLSGDWDGNGVDTIGLYNSLDRSLEDNYDPVRSEFHLKNSFSSGNADIRVGFGWHNDFTAITGDWDGDGVDGIGVYDPATSLFHVTNSLTLLEHTFAFGPPRSGWIPITGDWDGDGRDTIGLYDPVTSAFHLRNSLAGGNSDILLYFGLPASEWWPIAGDWDGDGIDTIGLYWREKSEFHLKNSFYGPFADIVFQFGSVLKGFYDGPILNWPGDFPVVGDWNDDGIETIGLFDPEYSIFFLLDQHRAGPLSSADSVLPFGWSGSSYDSRDFGAGRWPVAGRW